MSRLAKYNELLYPLTDEEKRDFINFFIGSLSVDVDDKIWEHSLEIAKECVERYK